jgi:anti-sigma factor RsiW
MLSSHPSPDALDRYRRGLLPPEELLTVDDHLASCAACREAALHGAPAASGGLLAAPLDGHPEYEELAAYVDGAEDDVAREVMEMHLADCASCREEVADLRAFKARQPAGPLTLTLSPQAGRGDSESGADSSQFPRPARGERVRVRGLGLRLALALPAAAVIIWMLIPRSAVSPVAPPPIDRPTARVGPAAGDPPPAAMVATLRDGGGVVTLDAAGQVSGLPSSLPQPEQTMLVAALSTGRMPLPELIREIGAEGEVLRGSGSGSSGEPLPFALKQPLGTAVESDRPIFQWERHPSARTYVVSIYDEDFARVAQSPELSSEEWKCDRPLARGKTYTWRVSALTAPASGAITVPAAPAPPARFVVLTRQQADELARMRESHPDTHLVMALAYARAGVRDAAERELRALQRDNPDAAIVRTLLASLR